MSTAEMVTTAPADTSGLAQTFAELQEVFADDEEYDETFLRPTATAFAAALSMTVQVYLLMAERFPRASVAADGGGGVRLTWTDGDRNVRLVFSAREPESPYLYHETALQYGLERGVTPGIVEEWLQWLHGNE